MACKDKDTVPDMYSGLKLIGRFDLQAKFPDGHVEHRSGKNLVTNGGEALTAKLLDINGSETAPNYLAFGDGTDGALKTNTQLGNELTSDPRFLVTSTVQSAGLLAMTWDPLNIGSSYTIKEMGIFNAVTVGTMFSRFLTQELTVVSGVVMEITWTLTISGVD